ncbi:MAG: class I SAM-dependent methyltransferase [Chloroflexi bacterium]|nr:class I SAM-dependent methyltransferase [Chloroflexota bacterium]
MTPATIALLIELNRRFYQDFGAAFAATRRRIQPGIRRVLAGLPAHGRWLDLGCGSGALAAEWAHQGRRGLYRGLDFSPVLIEAARQAGAGGEHPGLEIDFAPADLGRPDWPAAAGEGPFDGVLAFAVLHHLPSMALRRRILEQVRTLLGPGGRFIHSEWQFQHSPRLVERIQPWERAGLAPADVEPGDTLLDWRYSLPGQAEQVGLRYVHRFERDELATLAAATGFRLVEEFESDGQGGRLGLYQAWEVQGA